MIKVVAKNYAQEDKLQEVLDLYGDLVKETRKEEGCISYEVCSDLQDKRSIAIIEEWESREALDKHMNSEHFTRIVPQIKKYMTKETEINIYNKII